MGSNYRIAFITNHQIGYSPYTGKATAAGASARLRAILPAQYLASNGHSVEVISLHKSSTKSAEHIDTAYNLYVISKIFDREAIAKVERLVLLGKVIVFDFCDNYFEESELNEFSAEHHYLLSIARIVTVNTFEMGHLLRRIKPDLIVFVIPDCFETTLQPLRRLPAMGVLRCLVFGNRLVCQHLSKWLREIAVLPFKGAVSIEVLTQVDVQVLNWIDEQRKVLPESIQLTLTNWTEYQLDNSIRRSDLVLIPSDDGVFYRTKSPNRLFESVIAGLPVIAYPVPSYIEFIDDIPLTSNVKKGFELLFEKPDVAYKGLLRARKKIAAKYNSDSIGARWKSMTRIVLSDPNQKASLDLDEGRYSFTSRLHATREDGSITLLRFIPSTGRQCKSFTVSIANDATLDWISISARSAFLGISSGEADFFRLKKFVDSRLLTLGHFRWILQRPTSYPSSTRDRLSSQGLVGAWDIFLIALVKDGLLCDYEVIEINAFRISIPNAWLCIGPTDELLEIILTVNQAVKVAYRDQLDIDGALNGADLFIDVFQQFVLMKRIRPYIGTPAIIWGALDRTLSA